MKYVRKFSCARKTKKKRKTGDTLTSKQARYISTRERCDAIMKVEESFQANQLLHCTIGCGVRMEEQNGRL